jgi:hypothetical protein
LFGVLDFLLVLLVEATVFDEVSGGIISRLKKTRGTR